MKPTVIIDCHYLCYRAMYTMGNLSYDEQSTGIIFGFLNQILHIATKFDYPQFVFAWDSKQSYRRDVYPNYKNRDKDLTLEMIDLLSVSKPQFSLLRMSILPRLGFTNNFIQTGLEADDIIATITQSFKNPIVIVSADNDLYQLLDLNVSLYDPKTKLQYTCNDFIKEFELSPLRWVMVKILAGCNSDHVKGIPGVGNKTAVKFLTGKLNGKKKDLIIQQTNAMIAQNIPLVALPHEQTRPITLFKDTLNFKHFEDICLEYGFRSFLKKGVYEKWQMILT